MRAESVKVAEVGVRAPFSELFPIDPKVREAIAADMRARGFDAGQPIQVWDDGHGLTVIDGHTRLLAAGDAGLTEVAIFQQPLKDEVAALAYAFHNQRDRRNATPEVLVRAIKHLDETRRKPQGGAQQNPYGRAGKPETERSRDLSVSKGDSHESRAEVAGLLGVSPATVQRARLVYDDPEATAALEAGASINAASKIARENKRATPPPAAPEQSESAAPAPDPREAPWNAVRESGEIVKFSLIEAEREIRKELDALASAGLSVVAMMGDRRVSAGWNKALKQANAIAALLRTTIRGNGDDQHAEE